MDNETTDTGTQDTSSDTLGNQAEVDTSPADTGSTDQADDKQKYQPFQTGKEKFKVDGREYEWDFQTAQKWAQLGYAGRRAMQEKAELQKQHQNFYNQLVKAADTDMDGLYEVLTGRKRGTTQASQHTHNTSTEDPNAQGADPRYEEIQRAMKTQAEQLAELREEKEARLVEQESKAIENEFSEVEKKFPQIAGNKYLKHYIKAQYAAELRAGNHEATIEDVAFFVTQEMSEQERTKQTNVKESIAQKKAKGTVGTQKPGGEGTADKGYSNFEAVRKFAGLLPGN